MKVFDLGATYPQPEAKITLTEQNCTLAANFDTTGVVLAVSVYGEKDGKVLNRIDLLDVKKYEDGRFDSWTLEHIEKIRLLKFSSNGSYILASTYASCIYVLDAFEGKLICKFDGFKNEIATVLEASFTPDSKYVLGGSEDGTIYVWDVESASEVVKLEGHIKPSKCIKFNPHYLCLASACQNVLLWIPKLGLM